MRSDGIGRQIDNPEDSARSGITDQINARTIGIAGVTAAAGALALVATRKVTKLSPKTAKTIGALGGLVLGYVGATRTAAGKSFLPIGFFITYWFLNDKQG